MFKQELTKLGSKYKLWKVLHPNMEHSEIGCYLCCLVRGKNEKDIEFGTPCPEIRILANPDVKGGIMVVHFSSLNWAGWRSDCVEWIKYV